MIRCESCIQNANSISGSSFCSCNAGYFGDGMISCESCTQNANSISGSSSCFCKAGFHGNGIISCEACAPGTFYAPCADKVCMEETAAECSKCPAGTYAEASGASVCISCPAGTYQATMGSSNASDCQTCMQNADSPCGSTHVSDCFCNVACTIHNGITRLG